MENPCNVIIAAVTNIISDIIADDDDESALMALLLAHESTNYPSEKTAKKSRCVENTIPHFPDEDFKSHFRMTKHTFEKLLMKLGPKLQNKIGRPTTCLTNMLLSTLWMLSTVDSVRAVAERFNLSKSTVIKTIEKVCKALLAICSEVIRKPTLEEMLKIEQGFKQKTGFDGVIGVIDAIHIPIKTPRTNPEKYLNKKQDYSIVLQAVCDCNMLFWDCFCGYPGSVTDVNIFRNSDVYEFIESSKIPSNCHVIGDGAYPLLEHLMVPYKKCHINSLKSNYNHKLLETKSIIDNTFCSIKQRFQRLQYIEVDRTDKVPLYVLAACILHNFCVRQMDFFFATEEEADDDDDEIDDSPSDVARAKREFLCHVLG